MVKTREEHSRPVLTYIIGKILGISIEEIGLSKIGDKNIAVVKEQFEAVVKKKLCKKL